MCLLDVDFVANFELAVGRVLRKQAHQIVRHLLWVTALQTNGRSKAIESHKVELHRSSITKSSQRKQG